MNYAHTTRNLNYCGGFFAAGVKNAAICCILWHFCWTITVNGVYCGVLLDHCNSSSILQCPIVAGNLDIAVLQKPAAINISFCAYTIAAVKKTVAICEL